VVVQIQQHQRPVQRIKAADKRVELAQAVVVFGLGRGQGFGPVSV
jgi:hypothetical protein